MPSARSKIKAIEKVRSAASALVAGSQALRKGVHASRARVALRTEAFKATAKITPIPLGEFTRGMKGPVLLPGPPIDIQSLGGVGYYYALGAIVRAFDPKVIVEFGTYLGVGTLTMALNSSPKCQILTIDLPADHQHFKLSGTDLNLAKTAKHRCGEAFAGALEINNRVTQIRADSSVIRLADYVSKADLVLIDGGHTYELIKSDTENAKAVLTERGIILWDDYWWYYPEVVAYLDDLSTRVSLRTIPETNLVVTA